MTTPARHQLQFGKIFVEYAVPSGGKDLNITLTHNDLLPHFPPAPDLWDGAITGWGKSRSQHFKLTTREGALRISAPDNYGQTGQIAVSGSLKDDIKTLITKMAERSKQPSPAIMRQLGSKLGFRDTESRTKKSLVKHKGKWHVVEYFPLANGIPSKLSDLAKYKNVIFTGNFTQADGFTEVLNHYKKKLDITG